MFLTDDYYYHRFFEIFTCNCPPARSVHACEFIYVVMHVVLYRTITDEEKERRQVRSRGRLEGEFWMD